MKAPPVARYSTVEVAPEWVATRFDGCPECVARDNVPVFWATVGETLVCTYQCETCRYAWWTGWSIRALGVEVEEATAA